MPTPSPLPELLEMIVEHSLSGAGTPQVLADWLVGRSMYWKPFANALRRSKALDPTMSVDKLKAQGAVQNQRSQVVNSGMMFLVAEYHSSVGSGSISEVLISISRFTTGQERHWHRVVTNMSDEKRQELMALFPETQELAKAPSPALPAKTAKKKPVASKKAATATKPLKKSAAKKSSKKTTAAKPSTSAKKRGPSQQKP